MWRLAEDHNDPPLRLQPSRLASTASQMDWADEELQEPVQPLEFSGENSTPSQQGETNEQGQQEELKSAQSQVQLLRPEQGEAKVWKPAAQSTPFVRKGSRVRRPQHHLVDFTLGDGLSMEEGEGCGTVTFSSERTVAQNGENGTGENGM